MSTDDFYDVHQGEIFLKSRCIFQEHEIRDRIERHLLTLGYTVTGAFGREWVKDDRKVILCLVDDFSTSSKQKTFSYNPQTWFDSNTTVITDNRVLFEPNFNLITVPDCYFGIYSYTPDNLRWAPEKDFHLSINRIDDNRITLLLELFRFYGKDLLLNHNINYNAVTSRSSSIIPHKVKDNFMCMFHTINRELDLKTYPKDFVQHVESLLPIRNHLMSVEDASCNSWLTIVPETYVDDHVIALSEKVFRALVTPVPWVGLMSRNSIKFLENLGFDTMADIVDHSYNSQRVTPDGINMWPTKYKEFVEYADSTLKHLKAQQFNLIRQRAANAANQNRTLLKKLKAQLQKDLDPWLAKVYESC